MNNSVFAPKLLLGLLSVIFSLVIMENVLVSVNYPQIGCNEITDVSETRIAKFDPQLGWSYIPSSSSAGDYGVHYYFNKEGYRAETIDYITDFSKPIILIIGDSMLFGHGLDFKDTFGYKLKERLQDKYEVINFAVQAYGTDQMYLMMQRVFPIYRPKVVIMDFMAVHISRNVSRDRREFYKCSRFIGTKPLFSMIENEPKLIYNPQPYKLYDNPRILLLVQRLFDGELAQRAEKYGREITDILMESINAYAEKNGAKLYALNLDNSWQIPKSSSNVLGITNTDGYEEKYHLSPTDTHPNSLGTTLMVDRFMKEFDSVSPEKNSVK